ncbi:MAG: amidohydrolase family protein [Terriglobia bacterium]|jgi:predicted TIM-barrel fold metal-dependent hydrolase
MIDTNVDLFNWPFRRVVGDDPASLVTNLRSKGVTQAWVCSYEALLCRDLTGVNARLASAATQFGLNFLVPFGSISPKLPDWREDLRRCVEVHRMPGIRLHPNYHGYTLDDPAVGELLALAAGKKLLVQIAVSMEDVRTQNPLMKIPPVDPGPLVGLLTRLPDLRVQLLNAGYHAGVNTGHIDDISRLENLHFDFACQESVAGLAKLIAQTSPNRVAFGSHYPFFYFESSFLKVYEALLPAEQEMAVMEGNARRLIGEGALAAGRN